MKANRIFNYDEIKSILSAYNNHLKEFDLSKPLVAKIDLLCWGKSKNLVVFLLVQKHLNVVLTITLKKTKIGYLLHKGKVTWKFLSPMI